VALSGWVRSIGAAATAAQPQDDKAKESVAVYAVRDDKAKDDRDPEQEQEHEWRGD
jgi:hypothetical protein